MHRCAAPCVMLRVAVAEASRRSSARASAAGFRVNCAPVASARYSRLRLTAMARSRVTTGAMSSVKIQSTKQQRPQRVSTLAPAPSAPAARRHPDPAAGSEIAAHAVGEQRHRPEHPRQQRHQLHVVVLDVRHLVRDHPLQFVTVQRVEQPLGDREARVARVVPVANALRSGSGTTQTVGLGSPAAMAISSTTLSSCFWAGVEGVMISHAPAARRTRRGPVFQA